MTTVEWVTNAMTLNRRQFLSVLGVSALGTSAALLNFPNSAQAADLGMPAVDFEVPPLPYPYEALEPYIDRKTMQIHHDKHHTAYVKNLNAAIAKHPELRGKPLEALLQDLSAVPQDIRTSIRNNGGGHLNHSLFWETMGVDGRGEPVGAIATAIQKAFGDFASFKQQFNQAGLTRFGSGWAWLALTKGGALQVISTANQDSPLMQGYVPIMGNDVWEHAYYLTYQNRRNEYLDAWWNVVNWQAVNRRFEQLVSA
jgi:Fe-Mn family superoxide dismutase